MSTDAFHLPDDMAHCNELIRQQADTIRQSQRKIEQLEHYLEQLLRRQFGPRRELTRIGAATPAPQSFDSTLK